MSWFSSAQTQNIQFHGQKFNQINSLKEFDETQFISVYLLLHYLAKRQALDTVRHCIRFYK